MTEEECEVYSQALNKWGAESQTMMLFEEMAELQNAICKYFRKRNNIYDVATEIADVLIMAEQMSIIFGKELVDSEKKRKLERLKNRLGTAEKPFTNLNSISKDEDE